jgi:hypothetical protein
VRFAGTHRWRLHCLAVVALVLPGLSPAYAQLSYIEQFSCLRSPLGLQLPEHADGLRRIGSLRHETVESGGDRLFEFDGLRIWAADVRGRTDALRIARVEVTSPRWQLSSWANIGDTRQAVLERAGWPAAGPGPRLEFGGDTDAVTLHFDGERVVRIVYTCYGG